MNGSSEGLPGLVVPEESDKHYWHRYTDFYGRHLRGLDVKYALEFGVWKGDSIRWLRKQYPDAFLFGCDILTVRPEWPKGDRIRYFRVDQGSPEDLRSVFSETGSRLDLIIDDGSHQPLHQRNCLVESLRHLRPGGIYILEDLHTSHPDHPYFRKTKPLLGRLSGPLHVLLAIEHLKATSRKIEERTLEVLGSKAMFSREDVLSMFEQVDTVELYKRASLPLRCFRCGGSEFDYSSLKCSCGAALYATTDSMAAVIQTR